MGCQRISDPLNQLHEVTESMFFSEKWFIASNVRHLRYPLDVPCRRHVSAAGRALQTWSDHFHQDIQEMIVVH